jgi:hypothetical protein
MATAAPALTYDEYDVRRKFLEDLKSLSRTEYAKIFEILKQSKEEFSENSNGIFFDVAKLSSETFEALQAYMEFCRTVQREQAEREEQTRQVVNLLR